MDFNIIIDLEKKLLNPALRKNSHLLNELLDDTFIEFGTSGRIYDKKIIIEKLSEEIPTDIEAFDFIPVKISSDVVQIRFKTQRKMDDGSLTSSLRSSIWKKSDQGWRMVFHQGTKTESKRVVK